MDKPRRVLFPLFQIASNPEIPLTQIKERRFDLIDRHQVMLLEKTQADRQVCDVLRGMLKLLKGDLCRM